jgi:hypothetical protein
MLSVPVGSEVRLSVAIPLESVPVPRVVPPFRKVMLPLGLWPWAALGVTVAVKTTCSPELLLLGFAFKESVVATV